MIEDDRPKKRTSNNRANTGRHAFFQNKFVPFPSPSSREKEKRRKGEKEKSDRYRALYQRNKNHD